jgi:hypothetical protein
MDSDQHYFHNFYFDLPLPFPQFDCSCNDHEFTKLEKRRLRKFDKQQTPFVLENSEAKASPWYHKYLASSRTFLH